MSFFPRTHGIVSSFGIGVSPAFVSAEVGLIDAYTIAVLLDRILNEGKMPDLTDIVVVFAEFITSDNGDYLMSEDNNLIILE